MIPASTPAQIGNRWRHSRRNKWPIRHLQLETFRRSATPSVVRLHPHRLRNAAAGGERRRRRFRSFQDEFDLDQAHRRRRAAAEQFRLGRRCGQSQIPSPDFQEHQFCDRRGETGFRRGADRRPTATDSGIALHGGGIRRRAGWHIMPLVEATDDELTLLHSVSLMDAAKCAGAEERTDSDSR